jgi:ubiquinone/menaquinone biosynthesis C-methylase UbiE
MATDYEAVYRERADDYDRLVSAEDVDGNLVRAIASVAPIPGSVFVDVGAGTGRVTRLLLGAGAARVHAFDRSAAMLEVARRRLTGEPADRWQLAVADATELPIADGAADHAVAGWVFGHLRSWAADWRATIGRALDEMQRAIRPGGTIVVVETLGTGAEQPAPPNPALAEYYQWLEQERGMTRTWVRTDYAFANVATGIELCDFFFGPELAGRVRESGSARLPECTGLWSRK